MKGEALMQRMIPVLTFGVLAAFVFLASDASGADPAAGKQKYQQFCSSCHGAEGKGNGPAAASLNPKPRDHSNKKYMKTMSDQDIFKITKMGGAAVGKSPTMPPWGGALSDDDIRNVVAFIRTLAK